MSLIELPPELDKIVSELAKKSKKTKQQVIIDLLTGKEDFNPEELKTVAQTISDLPTPSTNVSGLNLANMLKELAMTLVYTKMLDSIGGKQDHLEKIYMYKILSQPDYTQLLIPLLLKGKDEGGYQELLKTIIDQQKSFQETLTNILFGQKLQSIESRINEQEEKINKQIPELINQEMGQVLKEVQTLLEAKMNDLKAKFSSIPVEKQESEIDRMAREIAKSIVKESLERVKQDISEKFKTKEPPEAFKKLDYNKLFDNAFTLVKDIIKATITEKEKSVSPPPPKEVKEISEESNNIQEQNVVDLWDNVGEQGFGSKENISESGSEAGQES